MEKKKEKERKNIAPINYPSLCNPKQKREMESENVFKTGNSSTLCEIHYIPRSQIFLIS